MMNDIREHENVMSYFRAVGEHLSALNGERWTVSESYRGHGSNRELWKCRAEFTDSHGRSFWIGPAEWPKQDKMFRPRGNWPQSGPGNDYINQRYCETPYNDIQFSQKKTAEQAAKDLHRRWISGFVQRFDEVKALAEKETKAKDDLQTVRKKLCDMIDGASLGRMGEESIWTPSPYREVRVSYAGKNASIKVEYEPTDLIIEIIKTVEKWRKDHPKHPED